MKCYLSTHGRELQFLLLKNKRCIRNTSRLNCSKLSVIEEWSRHSGSGLVDPVNQVPFNAQNVALPSLQPPMQSPRPPTTVLPPLTSNISVPYFSKIPQANQTMDQLALHLRTKIASMPGQLHLPNPPFAQQQKLPQSNFPQETQLPITHPMRSLPPTPNPLVNPPPFLPPQQLVNPQFSVIQPSIPASTTTHLPVPTFHSKTLTIHLKPALYHVLRHRNVALTVITF